MSHVMMTCAHCGAAFAKLSARDTDSPDQIKWAMDNERPHLMAAYEVHARRDCPRAQAAIDAVAKAIADAAANVKAMNLLQETEILQQAFGQRDLVTGDVHFQMGRA